MERSDTPDGSRWRLRDSGGAPQGPIAPAGENPVDAVVLDALASIRRHLEMEAAFVSEFADGRRIIRYVDSATEHPVKPGMSDPLEYSYCQRVIDGRLPEIIPDAREIPEAAAMPATEACNVRAHLSVPIVLSDGRIFGTFCCLDSRPHPHLGGRERDLMRVFASFVGRQIERELGLTQLHAEKQSRIASALQASAFGSVYQPIFDAAGEQLLGFEALTRFSAAPFRTPDTWFNEAAEVGMAAELEAAALEKALALLPHLPPRTRLALNVSPGTMVSGVLGELLRDSPLECITLEVTEHIEVIDYTSLRRTVDPLRSHGLRLAVDDAGAGYSSFRHILRLEPDLIKLDMALVRDIDLDRTRRSLASALVRFAHETGSGVVAEGVETEAELIALRELDVDAVQGYLLGRPLPLEDATALCAAMRRR